MADEHKLSPALQAQADAASVSADVAAARRAVAEADSAELDAATKALKARIGEATAGPYKGAVDIGTDAGVAEINHLARKSLDTLAGKLSAQIRTAIGSTPVTVLLTSAESLALFQHADALNARCSLVENAVSGALKVSNEALQRAAPSAGNRRAGLAAPIAAAALILGGVDALLGFARTDYKVGGRALAPSDRSLLLAVASTLRGNGLKVLVDGFSPPAADTERTALAARLAKLAADAATLRARSAYHTGAVARIDEGLEAAKQASAGDKGEQDTPPDDLDADPLGDRAAHEAALGAANGAVALFDTLAAAIQADAGGVPLLERAAAEETLRKALGATGRIVTVKLDGAWGTHVSKQNILSVSLR
ncbi:hypothetical protein H5V43_21425 (plasmid) [Sphingobium fuliginis]|jgi:hypothetical protein|uniref:Uncharacterized protein n=1 Tax=Sphingobium fuliginis (strain ATCC 27551) TaxID=336203 RepID=A0A7M2GNY5_SPHSA|nr:hypothetical protein [Sphingobium fuliginis]QOT74450.1 hypothetical protein H5V43_21425 [Sphingobium fuliginis]